MLTVEEIMTRLGASYGPRPWHARNEPITELIQTILSQNTSDLNSGRAFTALWDAFGRWSAIEAAAVDQIEQAIRAGGLAKIKAARIKAVLRQIREERGNFDLSFLGQLPTSQALAWLTRLPGVGPKTARCVLLFALGQPVIPVDTHVHRVARRLGLINSRASAAQAHDLLEALVAPEAAYAFHMYLIEHGRRVCKAPRPQCHRCVLAKQCPSSTFQEPAETPTAER